MIINDIITSLKSNSVLVAYLSFAISLFSFVISFRSYMNFARNEFIKKQIETVTQLVTYLHSAPIDFNFTFIEKDGSRANQYKSNIFEISELKIRETEDDYFENTILYSNNCNQILDIKNLIGNPFLPKSIADILIDFYESNPCQANIENMSSKYFIVIESNVFEDNLFHKKGEKGIRYYESRAFALTNFENLKAYSVNLERAIKNWLEKYKVEEINIRKDFKYLS